MIFTAILIIMSFLAATGMFMVRPNGKYLLYAIFFTAITVLATLELIGVEIGIDLIGKESII